MRQRIRPSSENAVKAAGWLRALLERIRAPHNFTCDVCGCEVFAGERVCARCERALPFNDHNVCPLCGRRVGEAGVCLECKRMPPGVAKARSVFLHEGEAARLVVRFKRGERYLAEALSGYMLPLLQREFADAVALTYVPMTPRAERRRGYNQSRVLAEALAARTGLPCISVAEKRRETASQKTLSRRLREENLAGCFRVTDRAAVAGKRLLIVDDTYTTGATVGELAHALRRAGAAEVFAITATSVEDKFPFGIPEGMRPPRGRR